ncbi:MA3 DOMAIN-CONTAINING TRANSLATION REGULATORY FACTOR 3-like [Malus sylvestris]|uniref:MA3 DOMAIN-CONTAINING TRANSLATION REGULATORY FACTOR 3-like n=1 Tax=Malus sylvestris TaxID=3752 RepID=UPI0021ABFF02|nr:MA3 DOMAIN-CONTAINING TRANSLATION REGULATORY FACTOR 3-like [Malus sylvestris]XP_050105406.1 MA3 DOMAIN-CONTAINING TRANSLATION REGULATORY FACTOR 3-like [Malus sylvestris]XP_050105407.1 MA3 DOMAIN-CONTAINING TRANSLATION REGULATORY FACTOR 3-like [Malus sylvestris]
MDFSDGIASKEHREFHRSASESADPLSASPLPISPRSPKSPKSSKSRKSPKIQGKHGKGSPLKHDRHSHSAVDGHPKKGGSGGKGTWGGIIDTDDSYC